MMPIKVNIILEEKTLGLYGMRETAVGLLRKFYSNLVETHKCTENL